MAGNKKPRKARSLKVTRAVNSLEVAADRAAKLSPANQKQVMDIVRQCFDAMRKGAWREPEWNTLAGMLNTAAMLASPGFNLLNDHIEKFHRAMDRLNEVAERVQAGYGWAANAQEINAMEKAVEFFGYQIQFASRGEYFRAIDQARAKASGGTWKAAA